MRAAPGPAVLSAPIVLAAMLCACSPKDGAGTDSYFPLIAGSRWTYTVSSEIDGRPQQGIHVISVIRQGMEGGLPLAVRRSEAEGNIGIEYALRTTPAGIERIAQRSDLEELPTPDEPPRMVLPLPLKAGASWRSPTTAYLILRKSEYPRELKYSHKAMMTYTVESMDETVSVPAGTFAHCARIAGVAHLTLYTDPVGGFRKVPLVTNEWYCKGVGMVKLERVEDVATGFFSGGSLRMELSETTLR